MKDGRINVRTEDLAAKLKSITLWFLLLIKWWIREVISVADLFIHPWENIWILIGLTLYGTFAFWLTWQAGWFNQCGHWNLWTGCY